MTEYIFVLPTGNEVGVTASSLEEAQKILSSFGYDLNKLRRKF